MSQGCCKMQDVDILSMVQSHPNLLYETMRSSSSKAYSIADVKVKNCYQSSLCGGITSEIHVSKTMSDPFALLASQPAQREICWVCKYKVLWVLFDSVSMFSNFY